MRGRITSALLVEGIEFLESSASIYHLLCCQKVTNGNIYLLFSY